MRFNLTIMQNFVTILVGVILAPIVFSSVESANVTGTTAIVLALVPIMFALSIVFASIKGVI